MAILTKLERGDFKEILRNYDLGRYRSHRHIPQALDNTVYLIVADRGKYLLKIIQKTI